MPESEFGIVPVGVADLIGQARETELEVVARERREREGQAAVDEALATATDLLLTHGETFGTGVYDTRGPIRTAEEDYSVPPVSAGEDRVQLEGRIRTDSGGPLAAGVSVYVLFTETPGMPKGRRAQLFTINGKFGQDGKPHGSKLFHKEREVTDPSLRIQYGSTILFIADGLRGQQGTQALPPPQPRTPRG